MHFLHILFLNTSKCLRVYIVFIYIYVASPIHSFVTVTKNIFNKPDTEKGNLYLLHFYCALS